jgi:hypothetical protein
LVPDDQLGGAAFPQELEEGDVGREVDGGDDVDELLESGADPAPAVA